MGPSPPHCQSPQIYPLLIVNSSSNTQSIWDLPSPTHCQSSGIPPLGSVNHPSSLLSLPHSQSAWVHASPLSITLGPFPPLWSITPLLTVSHPGIFLSPPVNHLKSLPSPLSVSPCTSPPFLTISHPRSLPSSPMSLLTTPHCKSPGFHPFLPTYHVFPPPLFTVTQGFNHPGSLSSPLSITLGPSSPLLLVNQYTPHCQITSDPSPKHWQSHGVSPLPDINYAGFLPSFPHCQLL